MGGRGISEPYRLKPPMTELAVAQLAYRNGLPIEHVAMAVAVAYYESSLIPDNGGDIDNPRPGCESIGLWAINSCPNYGKGPPRFSENHSALKDPDTNARSMVAISNKGTNWKPWTTRGKAAPRAPQVQKRLEAAGFYANPGSPSPGPSSTTPAPSSTAPLAVGGAGSGMSIWVRIAWFSAGMGLVIAGVSILGNDLFSDAVSKIAGVGSPDTGGDPLDDAAGDTADAVSGMTTGVTGA